MWEVKDSTIKLLGKTIQPLHPGFILSKADEQRKSFKSIKKSSEETQREATCSYPSPEELMSPSTSLEINDDPKTPIFDKESSSKNMPRKELPAASSNSQEKPQKPNKILRCPRCNCMDTKFCYFNTYNVNQPGHFCKHCQRYWTAGGTMRNTPVGFGRRKNKSSSSTYYCYTMVSEDLQGAHHHIPFSSTSGHDTFLRVNDPNASAKSALRATRGISKVDHNDLFQVFRSEGDETELGKKALVNLRANPAAMSRSVNFQETSWL